MQAPWPEVRERKEYSMNGRILLLVVMASLALAVFAPAAIAQDDDDDDYGAATATATATATAYADDDDGVAAAAGGSLPRTGGPALVAPIAGALLIGGGVAGVVALRRSRNAP
jgi:LPXTG-motif cell wall-anchored protein